MGIVTRGPSQAIHPRHRRAGGRERGPSHKALQHQVIYGPGMCHCLPLLGEAARLGGCCHGLGKEEHTHTHAHSEEMSSLGKGGVGKRRVVVLGRAGGGEVD